MTRPGTSIGEVELPLEPRYSPPMSSPLLDAAAALCQTFARETLLPQTPALELQGGAPVIGGAPPIVALLRDLAARLGLAELAAEAASDPAANDGLLADHALGAALIGPLTRVCPGAEECRSVERKTPPSVPRKNRFFPPARLTEAEWKSACA